MRDKKRALRGAILAKRESLSSTQVRVWGERIQRFVLTLPVYRHAEAVALYSPLGNEVETEEIRRASLETGKRLYYPRVEDGRARVVRVRSEVELVAGRYGILEPVGDQALPRRGDEALVVFVPGVAFDRSGNRLGRGSGWYDRFLGDLAVPVPRVALAYEFQLLEGVPVEPGDRPVDVIVTEKRVIECRGAEHRAAVGGETPRPADRSYSGSHASGR